MLKQPTTYECQLAKLHERGCEISDEAFCEEILSKVGYYRFSAYFLPYKTVDKKYKQGTEFTKVYSLYEFDRKMRHLLFSVIEEIEVYLRAQLSYFHAHKYGSDGYMNPDNYSNRHKHETFINRINQLITTNRKAALVKHHITVYDGTFPFWAIIELFSFGMLSYFYADMIGTDQKQIAFDSFNTTVSKMKSWLYCCTNLRNSCAHYGRLYNNVFRAAPAQLQNVNSDNKRTLFAAILAVRALYPDKVKWNGVFMPEIMSVFYEHRDVLELSHIGFPDNWEDLVRK